MQKLFHLFTSGAIFEYTYKWWRGNCENSPLPTICSAFQYVKVDLPFCIDVCTCAYVLKWYSAHFFLFFFVKKVTIPTFVPWNYCSALPMVKPLLCSERYTNCLPIIYMYTQRVPSTGLALYVGCFIISETAFHIDREHDLSANHSTTHIPQSITDTTSHEWSLYVQMRSRYS